jgi:hypothetical protein
MDRLLLCIFFGLSANVIGAADALSWLPLQVGHRWVYDCVSKNGDIRNPEVSRWTATITVRKQIPTNEGLVVVRSVTIEGAPNPSGGWPWDKVPLLVRGDCVYPLYPEGWDMRKRAFTPGFSAYIKHISPMFCFPLRTGATWKGAGDWAWIVEGTGPISQGSRHIAADAFRLKSQQSGSTDYVWFRAGVGPVASWSWHNGTYTEGFEKLRR